MSFLCFQKMCCAVVTTYRGTRLLMAASLASNTCWWQKTHSYSPSPHPSVLSILSRSDFLFSLFKSVYFVSHMWRGSFQWWGYKPQTPKGVLLQFCKVSLVHVASWFCRRPVCLVCDLMVVCCQIVGVCGEELKAAQHWNGPGVIELLRSKPTWVELAILTLPSEMKKIVNISDTKKVRTISRNLWSMTKTVHQPQKSIPTHRNTNYF